MPPKQKKKIGRPRKLFQLEEPENTPPPPGPAADPTMPLETLASAAQAAHPVQTAQFPQPHTYPQPYSFARPPTVPHAESPCYPVQGGPSMPPVQQYPPRSYEGYPPEARPLSRAHHFAREPYLAPTPPVSQGAQLQRTVEPWERLYKAKRSLDNLRNLPATAISSENHLEITDAINQLYHILSPDPTDIPDTPRHYSFEFKNQAATLAAEYVMYCLEAVPNEHVARKLFLDNVHEKLIKPITAREYIWGDLGIRLNEAWIKWDEYNRNLLNSRRSFPQSPSGSHDQASDHSPTPPGLHKPRETRRPMMPEPRHPTPFHEEFAELVPPPPSRIMQLEARHQQYPTQRSDASTKPTVREEMEVDLRFLSEQPEDREQTEDIRHSEDGDSFERMPPPPPPPPPRTKQPLKSSHIGQGPRAETVPPLRVPEVDMDMDQPATPTRPGNIPPYVQVQQTSRGDTVPPRSLQSYHRHAEQQSAQRPAVEVKVESPHSREPLTRTDSFAWESLTEVTPEDDLATKKGSEKRIVSDAARPPSIAHSLGINGDSEPHHSSSHFATPPKRPASRSLDDAPPTKYQRTSRIPKRIPRRKSTEELRQELEQKHREDEQFMAQQAALHEGEDYTENPDRRSVGRTFRRSMSRNDVEIVRALTPALEGLKTSEQRETSPPRQTWQTPSPQASTPGDAHILPRGGNALGVQNSADLEFNLQSVGNPDPRQTEHSIDPTHLNNHNVDPDNYTGAENNAASPDTTELDAEDMAEVAAPRVRVAKPQPRPPPPTAKGDYRPDIAAQSVGPGPERKRPMPDTVSDDDVQHRIRPEPKSTFDLVELMKKHDRENRGRPIHLKSFYVPQWGLRLASWDPSRTETEDDDGERVIEFVRYFDLEPRDIEESNRYIRFIRGQEARGPKTMIRLRFAIIPVGGNGEEVSAWPLNTHLLFNGQYLRTPQDSPLYISFVNLKDVNKLRVTLDLEQLQGACFKLYLEFFSVVDYHELEEYMDKNSPDSGDAKRILMEAVSDSGDWEVQIPLVCPGHEKELGPMKKPVYGRSCNHLERLDLDCFLRNVDVSPTFEWKCPFCKADCGLDWPLPIYSDKLVKGIIRAGADQVHSPPLWFKLRSDGVLSGDDAMDLDPGHIGASRLVLQKMS